MLQRAEPRASSTGSIAGTCEQHPGESDLEARIQSYELAAAMQTAAKEALDISSEPASHPPALRPGPGRDPRVRHALPDRPPAGRARRAVRPALPRRPAVGHAHSHPDEPAGDLPADRQAGRGAGQGPQAARAAGHDARPLGRRDRPAAGQRGQPRRAAPAATTTARASRSGWPAAASRAA